MDVTFEYFSKIFRSNIEKRSRTAKGVSDVSSTPGKKKLLLEGEDLRKQVEINTEKLIEIIWVDVSESRFRQFSEPTLRSHMECWYDTVNYKLQSSDVYAKERSSFVKEAKRLKNVTGRNYRINSRYRLATPQYLIEKGVPVFPIVELEFQMDHFYKDLEDAMRVCVLDGTMSIAQLLSFADMQIDGRIHPWADGCGRVATATVMWLALWNGQGLPIFGDRDEHYAALKANDESAHVRYFEECLERVQV